LRKVDYPFADTHINVKNLFALMHGEGYEVELSGALEYLGLLREGSPPRASDDAWNVASILGLILGSE
jgi:inhibitor of KinA sporulation pathway (predicted exonuclease)